MSTTELRARSRSNKFFSYYEAKERTEIPNTSIQGCSNIFIYNNSPRIQFQQLYEYEQTECLNTLRASKQNKQPERVENAKFCWFTFGNISIFLKE